LQSSWGYTLPDNAGEDSYSFLPILKQEKYQGLIREAAVHHSVDGRFAIRQDKWKLIFWAGSEGWSYPSTKDELQGLPSMQLYDLENDPSEKNNLVHKHPEIVLSLKSLMTRYIEKGRSTPGAPQKNDGSARWAEMDWMGSSAK
jgi:arylsulfatase A